MPISLPLVNRMLADGNLTISVFFCRVAEACHHHKHFDYYQIGQSVLLKADQTLCSFFLFVRRLFDSPVSFCTRDRILYDLNLSVTWSFPIDFFLSQWFLILCLSLIVVIYNLWGVSSMHLFREFHSMDGVTL